MGFFGQNGKAGVELRNPLSASVVTPDSGVSLIFVQYSSTASHRSRPAKGVDARTKFGHDGAGWTTA
jgi:hypothetical protein